MIKKGSRGEEVKVLQKKLNIYPDGIFGSMTEEAVKDFQKAHNLTVDGVVGAKTWEAIGHITTPNPRRINKLIVHCTATPEGKDYTVEQIRTMHIKQNGWSDIGYHYVIYRDGSVHRGRSESVAGAHTIGHNSNSIGICYVGGLASDGKTPKDTRTLAQKESLAKLLKELKAKYPAATIHGHNEFANKACPSFNAKTEYKNI